jgi:MFS family permease
MSHAPSTVQATPSPGRVVNKPALVGIAGVLILVTNAVLFLMPPLLPIIQAEYGLSTVAQTSWIFTVLTLGGGVGFIIIPRIADLYGDRNASVVSSLFITVGALVPAVGDSYATLVIGCAVMGVGGAAQLLPLGFLRRGLGESGLNLGVAVLVIATGIGIVVGMIGGGLVVAHLSLQAFFILLTVLAGLMTVGSFVSIPHNPAVSAAAPGQIGVRGTVWLIVWVGAILLALTQGLVWGDAALIPLAVGVVGGITWLIAERRSATPVFDASVLKSGFVLTASASIGLIAAVNAAFLVLMATYAQVPPEYLPPAEAYGLGLSALGTGILMLPFAFTFLVGSLIAEGPVARGRGGRVLTAGALTATAGLGGLAVAHDQHWQYLIGSGVVGLGCALVYSAGFALVQMAVPESKAGMASGMAGTFMAVGFAFGSALVASILSASVVVIPGTTIEVATENLFAPAYWTAAVLALFIPLAVWISRIRTARRVGVTTP